MQLLYEERAADGRQESPRRYTRKPERAGRPHRNQSRAPRPPVKVSVIVAKAFPLVEEIYG